MAFQTDTLIIGCGISGLTAALQLSQDKQRQITIITRAADPQESNSNYAQGGIATLGKDDQPQFLVKDILRAGAGLSLKSSAKILSEEGPGLIHQILIDRIKVDFDRNEDGSLRMTKEAAHSSSRILHVGDATGKAIIQSFLNALKEIPNVKIITSATAVDLITTPHHSVDPMKIYEKISCLGAYVFLKSSQRIERFLANQTILATGGIGQIYRYTSNTQNARGDGVAMAYRAGARVINAEFIQFHPTTLAVKQRKKGFLISEAVRGEGGKLITPDGEPFMQKYSPEWGDLAPRDVVARAIHHEMIVNDYQFVYLDIASAKSSQYIKERFPSIFNKCLEFGIDISRQPIPVVPAAHYFCGGVWIDKWGRTTIPNLFAIGEVSCTGVHGANRLASTSLLEGLVWGNRTAEFISNLPTKKCPGDQLVPSWEEDGLYVEADPALIWRDMRTIQYTMWHYVGLVRSVIRLKRAIRDLNNLKEEIEQFYRTTRLNDELIGLRHSVQAALIIAAAALHNKKSMGSHFRDDSKGAAVF